MSKIDLVHSQQELQRSTASQPSEGFELVQRYTNSEIAHPQAARLRELQRKHRESVYRKPISAHTKEVFWRVRERLDGALRDGAELILDSCCGKGHSTALLAESHPQAFVIGIDQSAARVQASPPMPENALCVRAECIDFWRLSQESGLHFAKHFLLYPNPYPKSEHLMRRWYAHPIFPCLMLISSSLELRSNMWYYIEECACVLDAEQVDYVVEQIQPRVPLTAFEKKYAEAGQHLWRLAAKLKTSVEA